MAGLDLGDRRRCGFRADRERLLGDHLLHRPLQVVVDRGGDRAAVDRLLLGDGAAGEADAVGAALVGGRAVRAREAFVLGELEAVLRALGSDEPDKVARDGPVGVDAGGTLFEVDAGDAEIAHGAHLLGAHLLRDVFEVGLRVLGEDLEHLFLGLPGDLRDLGRRLRHADRDLVLAAAARESRRVLRDRLRRHGDVEPHDAAGEHGAVAVDDVAPRRIGRDGDRALVERLGTDELDVDESHDEDTEHGDHRDQRQREPAPGHPGCVHDSRPPVRCCGGANRRSISGCWAMGSPLAASTVPRRDRRARQARQQRSPRPG